MAMWRWAAPCAITAACWLSTGCVGPQRGAETADALITPEVAAGIADSRHLAQHVGDTVWPAFSTAPFGFLLVTPDRELLLCDPRVPDGFTVGPSIAALGCSSASGPRSWRQPSFLAAMPTFGPPAIIVMGSPATTGRSQADWELTVLHEHFHQWQSALPGYYARVDALDLRAVTQAACGCSTIRSHIPRPLSQHCMMRPRWHFQRR